MAGFSENVGFESFYTDLKNTEKKDAVLTSKQQIDRLLRPGHTYLNLNPFEVLQIEPETDVETAKKKFKRLSLLIHPDKNQDDRDRADKAFDIVKKAVATIEDPDQLSQCRDVYVEAKARLNIIMSEKRRKLKKDGKDPVIDEDTEAGYSKALWVVVTKVFADREKKRKALEDRANEEKRRNAEEAIAAAEKKRLEQEYAKNYEETRDDRVGSWKKFKTKNEKKGRPMPGAFKPPKPKLETSGK
uniref:J domain-containing protein n=1 Tax=Plectus sambesii TaxID=2011161 RepID=A0A914WI55_9BILA